MYFLLVTTTSYFDHKNIIKYCDRPFANVDEMNKVMIAKWNEKVQPTDTIYCLGDFSFGRNPAKDFHRLNGNKILITGNHDSKEVKNLLWGAVHKYLEINVEGHMICLFHYAMKVWNKSHRNSWHLYGHSHATLVEDDSLSFDVGVDAWEMKPISFQEVKKKMDWKLEKKDYFKKHFLDINQESNSFNLKKINKLILNS